MRKNKNRISAFSVPALCASLVLIFALSPSGAAQAQVFTNPQVNGAVHFDISAPIRELAATVSPQFGAHQVHPVRLPKQQPKGAVQLPALDGALQTSTGPLVSATIGLNLLGVGIGFDSYVVPDAPTDVNLAVGDTQVVQWVNVSYAVFDEGTGAVIAGPIEGNQF